MRLSIKKVLYKILIVAMIIVSLSFFFASSVSQAKIKLKEGEFYYSGTQSAEYIVKAGMWDRILKALSEIANYILGIKTLGNRGMIVGWIEIMEIILTLILSPDMDFITIIKDSISSMDGYTQDIVNVEKILFNRVELLDPNIFKQ